MFPRQPKYVKKWNFKSNNVATVPLQNELSGAKKAKTSRIRRNVEEIKKKEEALHAKNRLLSFVTQKLLNNFGLIHKPTIAACVEAFFEVKNNFTADDINGLERIIRESIKSQQKQRRAGSAVGTKTIHPTVVSNEPPHDSHAVGSHPPPSTTELKQAIQDRKERQQIASRTPASLKNFKEGLDEQMQFVRAIKEKARQDWLIEAQKAVEDREKLRQLEQDKLTKERIRREDLKKLQLQQMAERRARDMLERETQRTQDKRDLVMMEQRYATISMAPRTASRGRQRHQGHKTLEGAYILPRPSTADGTMTARWGVRDGDGTTTPGGSKHQDGGGLMVSSWGFRQADHAVFGLQAEADHGTIDAESHSSRAVNRRIIDTSGSMGLFPNTHAGNAASQVRQKQQQQRQRPASAGASAPGLTTSSSLPSMGVSANDLKNAILARSAVASSGTWVDAGATGAAKAFSRHAAKAAEYANARMLEEQKEREAYEQQVLDLYAQKSNEQAAISLKQDEEMRRRKELEDKQNNKEIWLGAAAERVKEKKQWEEGMSPVERAVNRGILQKMKHYDRIRAHSAPMQTSPGRVSSHGALQPEKWLNKFNL